MPKYKTQIDYLVYEEEVKAIANSCKYARDKAIICAFWLTGCRTGELRQISREDIVYDDNNFAIKIKTLKLKGKNSFKIRDRVLNFKRPTNPPNPYVEYLIRYHKTIQPNKLLFPHSNRFIQKLVNKYSELAIGKQISPYHFRHSLMTSLAMNGKSIPEIMYFKGAISISGVLPYIHARPMVVELEKLNRDKGLTLMKENGASISNIEPDEIKKWSQEFYGNKKKKDEEMSK